MRILNFVALAPLTLGLLGCHGYATASELQKRKQGPDACEARCQELGMRMGALALIDTDHAGCVCIPHEPAPAPAQPAPPPPAPSTPDSAPEAPETSPSAPSTPETPAPEPAPSASVRESAVIAATGMLIAEEAHNQQQLKQRPHGR